MLVTRTITGCRGYDWGTPLLTMINDMSRVNEILSSSMMQRTSDGAALNATPAGTYTNFLTYRGWRSDNQLEHCFFFFFFFRLKE